MPSTTANTHAALWTGAWGDVNGITSNDMPLPPRGERLASARVSGYRSEGLRAEPLWVATARQGVRTVTQQATQVYPVRDQVTGGALAVPPTLLHGYQAPVIAPARWLRRKDLTSVPCTGRRRASRGVHDVDRRQRESSARPVERRRCRRGSCACASTARPTAWTCRLPPPSTSRRAIASWPAISATGLLVDRPGVAPVMAYFRLFEASPDGRSLVLFQSVLQEMVLYTGHEASRADAIAFLQAGRRLHRQRRRRALGGRGREWRVALAGRRRHARTALSRDAGTRHPPDHSPGAVPVAHAIRRG